MRKSHDLIAARVGLRLKKLRGTMTQAQYADQLGIKQAQYNRYETGRRLAPDDIIIRAAELANLEPLQVVFGGGEDFAGGQEDFAESAAGLIRLLDSESLEDLYYFLKQKTQSLATRQEAGMRHAEAALEGLLRKAQ